MSYVCCEYCGWESRDEDEEDLDICPDCGSELPLPEDYEDDYDEEEDYDN